MNLGRQIVTRTVSLKNSNLKLKNIFTEFLKDIAVASLN